MQEERPQFPDEALQPLAQRLPLLDVLRSARVSRAWRDRLGGIVLTEPVRMEFHGIELASYFSAAAWLAKNLHRTKELELARWRGPPPGGEAAGLPEALLTRAAANSLVRLSFVFWFCGELPILDTCTALKELRVYRCSGISTLPELDALEQLTRLEVTSCDRITSLPDLDRFSALVELAVCDNRRLASVPSLAGCSASLEALTFSDYYGTYNRLPLPCLSELTRLTHLQLKGCDIETHFLPEACPQLRALDIAHCDVAASQLLALTACTDLAELRVACCCREGTTYQGAHLPPLAALKALRSLRLERYSNSVRFPSLAGLSHLITLEISWSNVEPDQMAAISGCVSLVELEISSCSRLQQLPSLASCGRLRRLRIYGCCSLQALPPDLSGCTQLTALSCVDCPNLTHIPSLASCGQLQSLNIDSYGSSLQALPDLSGCTQLTALTCTNCLSLRHLPSLASCTQLQSLHIHHCRSLQALPDLSGCTQLEKLICTRCPALHQLPELAACTALKEVHFYDCRAHCRGVGGVDKWLAGLRSRGVSVVRR